MKHADVPHGPYGIMAEYETPEAVVAAAHRTREAGFTSLDAYTPFPVEGLAEAIGFPSNRMPTVVLVGGLVGGSLGYLMQWYSSTIGYPINVGGRPFHSWPMFLPITFEMTVLGAAFAAVLGMLGLNGLPRPHHPVFGANGFERATRDRFFLCVFALDPKFDLTTTREFLETTNPIRVTVVDR
jgi:Protein of unknown function (DUF3341)